MTHGYRHLQHWNQWLSKEFLGGNLLEAEQSLLTGLLERHFGKHALLIGVSHQLNLLNATTIPCHTLLSPLAHHKENPSHYVEGDLHELPFLTGSIDLVMLPHTLEFVDNPRQLLAEACRIIKPEGLIVICGFNPYSLWGLYKQLSQHRVSPWTGHFMPPHKVKGWLGLADFEMEKQAMLMFRPPLKNSALFQRLHLVETIGRNLFPMCGGVYILLARAKVVPLTPIRLKWKQQLSNIRLSTTISGHIARRSK